MKKLFAFMIACFVLLAGCSERPDSQENSPEPTNNFGTQAIRLSSKPAADKKTVEENENANRSQSSQAADDNKDASGQAEMELSSADDSDASADSGNPAAAPSIDVDVEIKEKMFMAQTSDIYMNAEDYLGKNIKYEGIFDSYTVEETNQTHYSVIRYGPGCCGDDGNVGFEIVWDGDYPQKNDWVEAIGELELYNEGEWQYLRLNLSSLTVLPTRGAEYVSQ